MQAIMNTYGRLPVTFVKGEGSWLTDTEGRRYLDALSGIAVCGLGHAHPAVTEAITRQAGQLIHASNIYNIERQQALASALTRISGMDNVFFSNSGAEANEAAIKIARKYGHDKGIAEPQILVMTKAFHGRTMATLTATGNAKVQEGFGPLLNGFIRVPYMDIIAIHSVLKANPDVVAIMLEPIQGEGGLATASAEYLQAVRTLCDDNDLLMMLDEVQTGNGRTGSYFCYQQFGFTPDVVTTAKGLGNGVPIGACLAHGKAADVLKPGNHGSTYGGNPLAMSVGLEVIKIISNKILIIGGGNIGLNLAKNIEQSFESARLKIIEKDKERAEYIANELNDTIVINGNGLDEDVLNEANLDEVETVIALTNDDEDNLMVSVLVEKFSKNKRTMALINKPNYSLLQSSLKIDDLIDPRMNTVSSILKHVHKGTIENAYTILNGEYEVIEADIIESSELINKQLKDSNLPDEIRIGAILRGKDIITPTSSYTFKKDDTVVLLSKRDQLPTVENMFRISSI